MVKYSNLGQYGLDIKKYKFFIASHKTIKAFMDKIKGNVDTLENIHSI